MPEQSFRLAAFKAAHPGVVIGAAGQIPGRADWWQARFPLRDGEQIVTGYTLGDLLDKLDSIFRPDG